MESQSQSIIEYYIVEENTPCGVDMNIGKDKFQKMINFYRNKTYEEINQMWKCVFDQHNFYIQQNYKHYSYVTMSSDTRYIESTTTNNVSFFFRKKIPFMKRTIQKLFHEYNDMIPISLYDIYEVNEYIYSITNMKTREVYKIVFRCITDKKTNDMYYHVCYVCPYNENYFFMLLPYYLWE